MIVRQSKYLKDIRLLLSNEFISISLIAIITAGSPDILHRHYLLTSIFFEAPAM